MWLNEHANIKDVKLKQRVPNKPGGDNSISESIRCEGVPN